MVNTVCVLYVYIVIKDQPRLTTRKLVKHIIENNVNHVFITAKDMVYLPGTKQDIE
jgi:hypothetical protein